MPNLELSVAIGDYDRNRPLIDGLVQIDGVDPVFMKLTPEEIFFRAFRYAEFDICEASLSSFVLKAAQGQNPYVGVPAFVSRSFRHAGIIVRTDRGISKPEDLKGKRIGCPEYQLTACVWIRALLQNEYGVKPSDVTWVRGGIEEPGREEKISLKLPSGVRIEDAPVDRSLNDMLIEGDIDAFIGPRAPSAFDGRNPKIGRLFSDPIGTASQFFEKTRIFPIMHIIGIRRTIVERHQWLPVAVLKAFDKSKEMAISNLNDASAAKVTLPFVEEQLNSVRSLMGKNFWAYGVDQNRDVLDAFLRAHHEQGLSPRPLSIDELFHQSTLKTFKV